MKVNEPLLGHHIFTQTQEFKIPDVPGPFSYTSRNISSMYPDWFEGGHD